MCASSVFSQGLNDISHKRGARLMVGTGVWGQTASESLLPSPARSSSLLHGASLCATMAKFGQEFHFPSSTAARFHLGITMQIAVPRVLNLSDSRNLLLCVSQPSLPLHVVLSGGVTHSNRLPPFPFIAIFTVIRNGRARRGEEKGTIHK